MDWPNPRCLTFHRLLTRRARLCIRPRERPIGFVDGRLRHNVYKARMAAEIDSPKAGAAPKQKRCLSTLLWPNLQRPARANRT
jgi:hypothetical protein